MKSTRGDLGAFLFVGLGSFWNLSWNRTPTLEALDRLEHWPLKASRSLGGILEDAAAADLKALSNQASAPLDHLECRNLSWTRTPTLEAPDRLEHWPLKAFQSLGGIVEDAAAVDRKALSNQASAPLEHLECRNPS